MTISQIPNYSGWGHESVLRVGPLQVKAAATNDVLTVKAFNTIIQGTPFAPTTQKTIGLTGRNLKVTVVDANNSETWAVRITGKDQFGNPVTERLPAAGSQVGAATLTGSKIFASVDPLGIVFEVATGDLAAADNVVIGSGDKVGIPKMFSPDLHEILDAELSVANQATAPTKVALTAANFDSTYFAFNAAAFTGSVVVAGDNMQVRFRTDCLTPDDMGAYPDRR